MTPITKRIILSSLFVLLALYGFVCYTLSNKILNTNSSFQKTLHDIENYWGTTYEEMIALLPPPEDFEVLGLDEIRLRGKYFTVSDTADCLFIFSHGWARGWENMLKYFPLVEDCECNIIMYDHRAHGTSEGRFPTGGIKESEDLLKITRWAVDNKKYEWDQIAWLGSSWGAGAALIAGSKDEDPAFIIADSPFQDWYSAIFERAIEDYGSSIQLVAPGVMWMVNQRAGINYREASPLLKAASITEPVLLFHSAADPQTNAQQSVNIANNLNASSQFYLTQWDNIHVMDVINNLPELKSMLEAFIQKNELSAFQRPDSLKIKSTESLLEEVTKSN